MDRTADWGRKGQRNGAAALLRWRIRLVRGKPASGRRRPAGPLSLGRRLILGVASLALVLAGGAGMAATPAAATACPAGACTATINVAPPPVLSVTVGTIYTSLTYSSCYTTLTSGTSTPAGLVFPNGFCQTQQPAVTITNGAVADQIYVNGANAIPSDNVTPWTLCNGGGAVSVPCTGSDGNPGQNQYLEENFSQEGATFLTNTPACDWAWEGVDECTASVGQEESEGLEMVGPSAPTDPSSTFTAVVTWTAVAAA